MHKLNFIIYYYMVVEKIKDKKGEFWCNFAIVGKLMSRHCSIITCDFRSLAPQGSVISVNALVDIL